jgi:FLYWCH zinc finger domain
MEEVEQAQFIEGKRKCVKLVRNNFVYKLKSTHGEKKYYRCESECGTNIVVRDGVILSVNGLCAHEDHIPKIRQMQSLDRMRRRAGTEILTSVSKIYK